MLMRTSVNPADHPAPPFEHPLDITVGRGRVIYADATTDMAGKHHPAGWVLPGGARTDDPERAVLAAESVNKLALAAG